MPSLAEHQSNLYTKMLLIGDSGSGKTGSLVSLVAADYKLRILDMDNGLESLKAQVYRHCPDKIHNVEYRTIRDVYKSSPLGPVVAGAPRAYLEASRMLDRWRYDEVDLGSPAEWGPEVVLAVDSLTFYSDAAFEWAKGISPGNKDPRKWYGQAQEAIEKQLALIQSESFQTNVIVISHVRYHDNPDGTRKGYPTAVGSALGPIVGRYFNSIALCQTKQGDRRTIQTASTSMIDLKNPKPFEMLKELPLETGLADFFKTLRNTPTQTKPLIRKIR